MKIIIFLCFYLNVLFYNILSFKKKKVIGGYAPPPQHHLPQPYYTSLALVSNYRNSESIVGEEKPNIYV